MLLRRPDVLCSALPQEGRVSATDCHAELHTHMQAPHYYISTSFFMYLACLRLQQSGHLKHDILMPYPAALLRDYLTCTLLLLRTR